MTWGWVNYQQKFFQEWTNPLRHSFIIQNIFFMKFVFLSLAFLTKWTPEMIFFINMPRFNRWVMMQTNFRIRVLNQFTTNRQFELFHRNKLILPTLTLFLHLNFKSEMPLQHKPNRQIKAKLKLLQYLWYYKQNWLCIVYIFALSYCCSCVKYLLFFFFYYI